MKKYFALILALTMMLSVAACGQKTPAAPASSVPSKVAETEKKVEAVEKKLDFPTRPITIIVPWSPGGSDDTSARKMQALAQEKYGVKIVVENVTGGSSDVAMTQVLNTKNDGYTLGQASFSYLGLVAQGLVDKGLESMDLIAMVMEEPIVMYAKGGGKFKTLEDVIKANNAGTLTFGRAGSISATYCYYNLLQKVAKTKFNPISYEGSSRTITEILGGNCDVGMSGLGDIMFMIKEGTISPVVTFTKERLDAIPNTQTVLEAGYDVFGYGEIKPMSFLIAPKGVDPQVKAFLQTLFNDICASSEYQEYANAGGFAPERLNEADLRAKAQGIQDGIAEILKEFPLK